MPKSDTVVVPTDTLNRVLGLALITSAQVGPDQAVIDVAVLVAEAQDDDALRAHAAEGQKIVDLFASIQGNDV